MKTIQEHLKSANRERLIQGLTYDFLSKPRNLLELSDCTVAKIMERYSKRIDLYIERLLRIDAIRSDTRVFYLFPNFRNTLLLDLVDVKDIQEDINAPGLNYMFSKWQDSLGYLVAETKVNMNNLFSLLTKYLKESSFVGTDEDSKAGREEEIIKALKEELQVEKDGKSFIATEKYGAFRDENAFPFLELDSLREELRDFIFMDIDEHDLHSRTHERVCILTSFHCA